MKILLLILLNISISMLGSDFGHSGQLYIDYIFSIPEGLNDFLNTKSNKTEKGLEKGLKLQLMWKILGKVKNDINEKGKMGENVQLILNEVLRKDPNLKTHFNKLFIEKLFDIAGKEVYLYLIKEEQRKLGDVLLFKNPLIQIRSSKVDYEVEEYRNLVRLVFTNDNYDLGKNQDLIDKYIKTDLLLPTALRGVNFSKKQIFITLLEKSNQHKAVKIIAEENGKNELKPKNRSFRLRGKINNIKYISDEWVVFMNDLEIEYKKH